MYDSVLRALTIMNFSYLQPTKCKFLSDEGNKPMACYIFSVRPNIPESENLKIAMKEISEEENEDFCEVEYFNFEDLIFGEEKSF